MAVPEQPSLRQKLKGKALRPRLSLSAVRESLGWQQERCGTTMHQG